MVRFLRVAIAFFLSFALVLSPLLQTWGFAGHGPAALDNVGAINRGQMAYYLEHGKFSNSITDLGLGIDPNPNRSLGAPFSLAMQIEDNVALTTSTYETPIDKCVFYLSDWLTFLSWLEPRRSAGWLCLQSKPITGYTGVVYVEPDAEQSSEIEYKFDFCMNFSADNAMKVDRQTGEIDCGDNGKSVH